MHLRGKFKKTSYMRLIGHLDLMKLFQRALKRSKIQLRYTEGFNPTPRLSIPNPLPLGVESTCEYIEFDTIDEFEPSDLIEDINAQLPLGIDIIDLKVSDTMSSISREIKYSSYRIYFPEDFAFVEVENAVNSLKEFDSFIVYRRKRNKKRKRFDEIPIDVGALIHDIKTSTDERGNFIEYVCHSSDGSNLRADVLIGGISKLIGVEIDFTELQVIRTGQYSDEQLNQINLEG